MHSGNFTCLLFVLLFGTISFIEFHAFAQDFTGDTRPDILWRRRDSTSVWLWQMNGVVLDAAYAIANANADTVWKVVGTGDFGRFDGGVASGAPDGKQDILWQGQTDGVVAIWYMNGTNFLGGAFINLTMDPSWQVVGAGDFGSAPSGVASSVQDGKADIVWQKKDPGGIDYKMFWLMDGPIVTATNLFDSSSEGWTVAAVADFGNSAAPPVLDGKPDLVLANYNTGQLAIQYMNGITLQGQRQIVTNGTNDFYFGFDLDYRVVGAAKFSSTTQGNRDILSRHHTDGRQFVWPLNGSAFVVGGEAAVLPHTFDTEYRMNTEELTDSVWRITRYTNAVLTATAVTGPPTRIDLTFIDYPPTCNRTYYVFRKPAGSGSWTSLTPTGIQTQTYSDTNVVAGAAYDYKVSDLSCGLNTFITAAVDLPPVHNRGRLLLIVEQQLAGLLGQASLDSFIADLASDGWTIIAKSDAGRHHDPNWDSFDTSAVATNKDWIVTQYNQDTANTKCVLLLGHVAVPYSGTIASDGHSDHKTPWAADLYYGDVAGPAWAVNPSTGQFTNDYSPSTVELAVGRIDFARLTSFGITDSWTTSTTEAAFVQQYLAKNHRYRLKQSPFPVSNQVMFTAYIDASNPNTRLTPLNNAKRNSVAFFGNWPGKLFVGEPFRNNASIRVAPVPCLWAFTDGNGNADRIYGKTADLDYTTAMISANAEPPISFWVVFGSYFADFNLPNDLARGILAKPSYGLAVIPTSDADGDPKWNFEPMALGETIGSVFLSSINVDPTNSTIRHRWFNIQGDPTLRQNSLASPANTLASLVGTTVTINWSPGESTEYYVYRGPSVNGPFDPPLNSSPITGPPWTYSATDDPAKRVYMVRGRTRVATGSGSYWNLSQGAITTLQ